MYEIDDNVPPPPNHRVKYPLRDLEVGQSFLVPYENDPPDRVQKRMVSAACGTTRMTGAKFTTKMTSQGVRVWRVA